MEYAIVTMCVVFSLCIIGILAKIYELQAEMYKLNRERIEDFLLAGKAIRAMHQRQEIMYMCGTTNSVESEEIPERM